LQIIRRLGAIGAQQLRVPRQIVCPMPGDAALPFDAQSATHAGEKPGVVAGTGNHHFVWP
jgi:hypothetical protein